LEAFGSIEAILTCEAREKGNRIDPTSLGKVRFKMETSLLLNYKTGPNSITNKLLNGSWGSHIDCSKSFGAMMLANVYSNDKLLVNLSRTIEDLDRDEPDQESLDFGN
jgi:hypothetical protein